MSKAESDSKSTNTDSDARARFHFKYGWYSLLIFLTLGLVLETFHGFKVDMYLSVKNETRRLMWRLAHAHGAFLSLIHIAFASTVVALSSWAGSSQRKASRFLTLASLLIPLGFFGGGIIVRGGDPMLAILLVPVGAFLLGLAALITGRSAKPNA